MNETEYMICVGNNVVARDVSSEYAIMFVQAILNNYWAEMDLEVSIKRQYQYDPEVDPNCGAYIPPEEEE